MKLSWRASFSFRLGPRKKRGQDIHPFALLTQPPRVEGGDIGVYVCVCVCMYVSSVFIPLPQQYRAILLTTYLTHRPSVLSSPRSRLMAFENSNIIRRSILSPLRTGTPQGPRDLEDPRDFVPLAKGGAFFFPGSVLNLILVGSDSINNVSIDYRDSHSITCRECRYTVLITRLTINSCQSFPKIVTVFTITRRLTISDSRGMIEKIDLRKVLSFKVSNTFRRWSFFPQKNPWF